MDVLPGALRRIRELVQSADQTDDMTLRRRYLDEILQLIDDALDLNTLPEGSLH